MNRGINVVDQQAVHAMAVRKTVPVEELPKFFGETYEHVGEYISRKGGKYAGPPFATYYDVDEREVDVEAGFPAVFDIIENVPMEGDIHPVDYPGGEAVEYVYFGPYEAMTGAYTEITDWLRAHGKEPFGPPREVYVSEPEGNPADWETHVVQFFR